MFISGRILVVDLLLQKHIRPSQIAGLVVVNAHKITETSAETFIARLYRMENNVGYIKAISEDPQRLSGGFHKMEKVMKWLFLRSVSLWPRFRSEVSEELEQKAPEVIELHQSLSPNMAAIQMALVETMDMLLKELRKSNKV